MTQQSARFWSKVEKTPTCWLWRGGLHGHGYGQVRWDGRRQKAHRVSYQMFNGPIPDGLELDHLCRTRACVRPDHLEAVTHRTNCLRGSRVRIHGSRHGRAKLNEEIVKTILERLANGASCFSLAPEYSVDRAIIQRIRNGTLWRHVERPKTGEAPAP